ncbi:phage tail sheath family protein [Streptomyces sp. S186]|uniref:phage tail sheath family protein n=1 Tax=Streptomyces sp. S186 TaxID=3434395 RepID=UPI003F662934
MSGLTPGVYVDEVPSGVRVVTGAGTSTPAFLGLTYRGDDPDSDSPQLVRSWQEFHDRYATDGSVGLFDELKKAVRLGEDVMRGAWSAVTGGEAPSDLRTPDPGDELERFLPLAEAVHGFFANGGASCYVVPLVVEDNEFASLLRALEGGLEALESVHDVQMVAAPDIAVWATSTGDLGACARKLAAHCLKMRNRVSILDTLSTHTPVDLAEGLDLGLDGAQRTYAAVYYPWVQVPGLDGRPRQVPPCGHLAGIWAATDATRGVHKAPANVVIHGITGLTRTVSADEQGPLNNHGINCLRAFPGQGPTVWGARTQSRMESDPDYVYLNVRRLVCQRTSGAPRRRTADLPTGGHEKSPLVDVVFPRGGVSAGVSPPCLRWPR